MREPHPDGPSALLALEKAFDRPTPRLVGGRYLIVTPDGRELPFAAVYTELFGERPVLRDNKPTRYPRLDAYRQKQKAIKS